MELKEKKNNLIKHLIESGYLKTEKVIKAFKDVPRENFVRAGNKNYAYSDTPLSIGFGQTISAPHMVAIMTEHLKPEKTDIVLEVGAGSGYQAAILSGLVMKVYTIELDPNLAEFAKSNLKHSGIKNVEVIQGDGSRGYPEKAPYDKIIITCACHEIPNALIDQLKTGGIIEAPVGSSWRQELIVAIKTKKGLEEKNYGGCIFVPLRH